MFSSYHHHLIIQFNLFSISNMPIPSNLPSHTFQPQSLFISSPNLQFHAPFHHQFFIISLFTSSIKTLNFNTHSYKFLTKHMVKQIQVGLEVYLEPLMLGLTSDSYFSHFLSLEFKNSLKRTLGLFEREFSEERE